MQNKKASKFFVVRNSKCRSCIIEAMTYLISTGEDLATIVSGLSKERVDVLIQRKILSEKDLMN